MKWQPDEFVKEACKLGHPFGSKSLLPREIRNVIDDHFDREWQDIIGSSGAASGPKTFCGLHMACHPDVKDIIQGKRLLLWRRMLLDVGYVDADLPLQFFKGFDIVGEVPDAVLSLELSFVPCCRWTVSRPLLALS